MVNNIRDLIAEVRNGKQYNYLFFYGHYPAKDGSITKSCLSQWWDCKFVVDGIEYANAEQYMMAGKAQLFGDKEIADRIAKTTNHKDVKALGRKVKNFDPKVWDEHKYEIVKKGNLAKFSQNPELLKYLLSTGEAILVEASPYDTIWGIGMRADSIGIDSPTRWRGQNLLGFALTEVREQLKNK